MLKIKLIGLVALVLGAVACEPVPMYPETEGRYRPYPQRPPYERDPRAPQYGDERGDPRNPRLGDDPRYGEEIPQVERVPSRDQYPIAERTDNPSRVLSPYAPYNVIDVQGFRSGQLAKDPSNGKIFRIP
jgi:hypothetical protein